jgi:hypothetical protein
MDTVYLKVEDLEQSWNIKKYFKLENKDIITLEDLIGGLVEEIEDLEYELYNVKEELETTEENIKEYYVRKSDYEINGVSERDFH